MSSDMCWVVGEVRTQAGGSVGMSERERKMRICVVEQACPLIFLLAFYYL